MGRAGRRGGGRRGGKKQLKNVLAKAQRNMGKESSVLTLDSCYRQTLLIFRLPEQYTIP